MLCFDSDAMLRKWTLSIIQHKKLAHEVRIVQNCTRRQHIPSIDMGHSNLREGPLNFVKVEIFQVSPYRLYFHYLYTYKNDLCTFNTSHEVTKEKMEFY